MRIAVEVEDGVLVIRMLKMVLVLVIMRILDLGRIVRVMLLAMRIIIIILGIIRMKADGEMLGILLFRRSRKLMMLGEVLMMQVLRSRPKEQVGVTIITITITMITMLVLDGSF